MTREESAPLVLALDHDPHHRLRLKVLFEDSGIPFPLHFVASHRELFYYLDQRAAGDGGAQASPRLALIMLDVDVPDLDVDETVNRIKAHAAYLEVPLLLFRSSHPEGDFSGSWLEVGSLRAKPVGLGAILRLLLEAPEPDQDTRSREEPGRPA
jgi:CheY-like chemotaxis protein